MRTYVTFAAKWLIPRLPDFQLEHPQIEVRISTAVPEVDFDRDPVDVAIQFGDGRWPRVQADLLFEDEIERDRLFKRPLSSPRHPEYGGNRDGAQRLPRLTLSLMQGDLLDVYGPAKKRLRLAPSPGYPLPSGRFRQSRNHADAADSSGPGRRVA